MSMARKPLDQFDVPAAGAHARAQHHESRQVLRLAAETVQHPRAHRRPAHLNAAAEQQQLPGMMVEGVGVHRAHQAQIVRAGADVRDVVGKLDAALAVRLERARAGQHRGVRLGEGQAQVLGHLGRQRLAAPLLQVRLGVEEIDLAGAAFHEHEDHVLGLGGKVRLLGRQRIHVDGGSPSLRLHQLRQRDDADPACALSEEAAAALDSAELFASP